MFDHETPKIPPIEVQCKAPGLKVDLQASFRARWGDGSRIRAFADVDLQHFSCPVTGPWKMLEKSIFHGKIDGFRLGFSLKNQSSEKTSFPALRSCSDFFCQKNMWFSYTPWVFFWDVSYGVWSCKIREDCPAILPSTLLFMEVLPVPPKSFGKAWKWWSQVRSYWVSHQNWDFCSLVLREIRSKKSCWLLHNFSCSS